VNLLVDLGNARIKWAQSAQGHWRTAAHVMANEPVSTMLDRLWSAVPPPELVVLCNVAGAARLQGLENWVERHWSLRPYVVRPQKEMLGVRNGYRDPASLGADRWVALIAARHLMSGPVCIVDCGTAVTLDALSAEGVFLGGVIFPGLGLLRVSLAQATDGISEILGDDTLCLARSTADAVAAGSIFGLAGAVERVLEEYRKLLGDAMQVVGTGADAAAVLPRVRATARQVPDLVLRGLALIADEVA
jgi:type III pantothenate kinase